MTNKIVICLNVFNEVDLIEASLKTILPYIDDVLLVDGSYVDYPTPYDYSMDGTVERAKYVTEKAGKGFHYLCKSEGRWTEVQKRTAYFKYIQEYLDWKHTWALIWDADFFLSGFDDKNDESTEPAVFEQIAKDFQALRDTDKYLLATCKLKPYGIDNSVLSEVKIAYRAIPQLHYFGNHFTLRDINDGPVSSQFQHTYNLGGVLIKHKLNLRSEDRIEEQRKYYCNVRQRFEV